MISVSDWFIRKEYDKYISIHGFLVDIEYKLNLFDGEFLFENNIDVILNSNQFLTVKDTNLRSFLYRNIAYRGGGISPIVVNVRLKCRIELDDSITNIEEIQFLDSEPNFEKEQIIKINDLEKFPGNHCVPPTHYDPNDDYLAIIDKALSK